MRDENPARTFGSPRALAPRALATRDFGLPRFAATLLFVLLVAYPFSRVLQRADFRGAIPPELLPIALGSVVQAGWSLLVSLAVGIPLGLLYARAWSAWIRGFALASFSMPAILVVGMFGVFLRGTEFRFGLIPVVAAHAFLNAPWIALATAEGLRTVPRGWIEAARTLGATRARAFVRIELPWVAKRIALAAAQVFALCLTSFAVVLVLGGGPPIETLEIGIFAAVRGAGLSLANAAWFSVVELALAGVPLICVANLRPTAAYRDSLAIRTGSRPGSPFLSALAHGLAGAWFLLPGIAFARYASLLRVSELFADDELRAALAVTVRIAGSAALLSLGVSAIFAWGARRSRFVRILAALPVGMSPLMIALGFFLAYSEYVDPFEGSAAGMVGVQAALFLPFALRFFLPLIDEEASGPRRDLRLVARTLGASPFVAWRKLEWPRWRAAGLRLGGLVFVWSFSELAAASFFGSERLTTVGVLLIRWVSQYRFEDVNTLFLGLYFFSGGILLAIGRSR